MKIAPVIAAFAIAAFTFLFGTALFPHLLVSTEDPANSLTVANASSTETTLVIMLIMAGLGIPFVLAYTATIYWIFRGKVVEGRHCGPGVASVLRGDRRSVEIVLLAEA